VKAPHTRMTGLRVSTPPPLIGVGGGLFVRVRKCQQPTLDMLPTHRRRAQE